MEEQALSLRIGFVTKLDTPYIVMGPGIVDNNSIAFRTDIQGDKEYKSNIRILNIANGKVDEIGNVMNSYYLSVSPDGKTLLYSDSSEVNSTSKTYVYDIQTMEIRKTFEGVPVQILSDSNRYIGILNDSLFIQDVLSGERKNLTNTMKFPREAGLLYKNNTLQPNSFKKMMML